MPFLFIKVAEFCNHLHLLYVIPRLSSIATTNVQTPVFTPPGLPKTDDKIDSHEILHCALTWQPQLATDAQCVDDNFEGLGQ